MNHHPNTIMPNILSTPRMIINDSKEPIVKSGGLDIIPLPLEDVSLNPIDPIDRFVQSESISQNTHTYNLASTRAKFNIILKVHTKIANYDLEQKSKEAFVKEFDPRFQSDLDRYYAILKKEEDNPKINKSSSKSLALWITISPPEEIDFSVLSNFAHSMAGASNFEDHLFSFECRTHNPPGGYHCHMLILRPSSIPCSQMLTQLKSKYKTFFKIASNSHSLDVKYPITPEHITSITNYIKGLKVDKDKMEKVKLDKEWRLENDLLDFYTPQDELSEEEVNDESYEKDSNEDSDSGSHEDDN